MADGVTVKIDGLKEIDAALGDLGKTLSKGVLRRVGIKALEPMRQAAQENAPVLTGHLQASITVGTKLTRRQTALFKKTEDRATVTVFMGPNDPAAVPQEFGWEGNPPQPYMRPAYDAGKGPLLDGLKPALWAEIEKTAARKAKREAKKAAEG